MTKNYLSPSAAALRLDVSMPTMYKMLNNGTVKGMWFGSRWRIPLAEIERIERLEAMPKKKASAR